ncbi:MAG TPA: phasin family protein [Casimicrobiaceae bacterium]|jgi:phasin family protein|nr:phasin family protein [Casimicrobiaceae bacterium]
MAKKAAARSRTEHGSSNEVGRKRSAPKIETAESADHAQGAKSSGASKASSALPGSGDVSKMAQMMTPEQALDLYKTNAALALAVINAAIEGAGRLRRKQFEGEEEAREFQRKHAKSAAQARDPQALVAAGQGAAQEAMERSLRYWSEMFDLIVEIQKRLFALMDEQMEGVPGVRETRAALAMMPDMGQMQKVVSAMQGVVSSGESTFASMQRVMGDFAKLATASGAAGNRR